MRIKGNWSEQNERNHVYDFSSVYSDTFPLILVFYAAFY